LRPKLGQVLAELAVLSGGGGDFDARVGSPPLGRPGAARTRGVPVVSPIVHRRSWRRCGALSGRLVSKRCGASAEAIGGVAGDGGKEAEEVIDAQLVF
jgi:hypothetical protein